MRMKDSIKCKIFIVLTVLPLLLTAVTMPLMPNRVPMHYNGSGHIDRWGSKYENLVFPIFIILMAVFMGCLILYYKKKQQRTNISDKERKEAITNTNVLYITTIGMTVLFDVLNIVILYAAYVGSKHHLTKSSFDICVISNILIGILMIVLGNYMPKTKRNATVGLRTVWSMHNDKTWAESNRLGGYGLVITGFLVIIGSCFVKDMAAVFVMLAFVILDAIISVVISYRVYKKYKDYSPEEN